MLIVIHQNTKVTVADKFYTYIGKTKATCIKTISNFECE